MKKNILFLLFVATLLLTAPTSCVSLKKYNALEKAYQKAGHLVREYEQGHKMWQIELQDREAIRNAKRDSL